MIESCLINCQIQTETLGFTTDRVAPSTSNQLIFVFCLLLIRSTHTLKRLTLTHYTLISLKQTENLLDTNTFYSVVIIIISCFVGDEFVNSIFIWWTGNGYMALGSWDASKDEWEKIVAVTLMPHFQGENITNCIFKWRFFSCLAMFLYSKVSATLRG